MSKHLNLRPLSNPTRIFQRPFAIHQIQLRSMRWFIREDKLHGHMFMGQCSPKTFRINISQNYKTWTYIHIYKTIKAKMIYLFSLFYSCWCFEMWATNNANKLKSFKQKSQLQFMFNVVLLWDAIVKTLNVSGHSGLIYYRRGL